MFDEIENKASRGSIPQIILTILSDKSRYGYEICKEIERLTNGELVLKQPSLYSSLRRLETQELISSSWQDSEIGAKRHYYFLTKKGKKHFEQNKNAWQLDELINKLPLNNVKESADELSEKKSYSVASQETLFNLSPKKDEIKRIDEDEKNNDNQFFFQYDLFNQNVKSVKKPSIEIQKVEAYSNKYKDYDNNEADFEPLINEKSEDKTILESKQNEKLSSQKSTSLLKNVEPIVRNVEQINPFEDDNESNFNINELIEENDSTSLIKDEIEQKINPEHTSSNEEIKLFNDNQKDEINEVKILSDDNPKNDKMIERQTLSNEINVFESNDYRSVIGKLFSNSQKADPYEQNKFNTFKEIFPQTRIMKSEDKKESISEIDEYVASSSKGDIEVDDIEMLGNLFSLQGIKIKTHKNVENKKNNKKYTDKNKLNMVSSWIISLIMLIETIFTYIILHNNNFLVKGQLLFFFLGGALALSIFIVSTLENLFDKNKLVILKVDFKKGFTLRLLSFIIISVITFAICLAFGMQGLAQVEFLTFWLIPITLSSNIIVSYLVYCFLLSHKYFNI